MIKKNKELIIALKEITLDSISSESSLFQTYRQIYNYSWGLGKGFLHCEKLTKKEYNKFMDWLKDITSIGYEEKINVGTFFKPKYEMKKMRRWRTW